MSQLESEEAEMTKKISDLERECQRLDLELMAETGKQNDLKNEEKEWVQTLHTIANLTVSVKEPMYFTSNSYLSLCSEMISFVLHDAYWCVDLH